MDWTGSHQSSNCSSKRQGQPFKPCKVQGCGKKYHDILHGSQNAYVNHKTRVKPKKVHNKMSYQSDHLKSAVVTVDAEGSESYSKPPTVDELMIQDTERINAMFLVEEILLRATPRP